MVWAILVSIFTGQKYGKKVGFCGQGISNSVILRGLVCIAGIVSASVVPDTYFQTVFDIAAVEAENIPTSKLGEWLGKQHHQRLAKLMEEAGYGHILKSTRCPRISRNGTKASCSVVTSSCVSIWIPPRNPSTAPSWKASAPCSTSPSSTRPGIGAARWKTPCIRPASLPSKEQAAALEEYRKIKF